MDWFIATGSKNIWQFLFRDLNIHGIFWQPANMKWRQNICGFKSARLAEEQACLCCSLQGGVYSAEQKQWFYTKRSLKQKQRIYVAGGNRQIHFIKCEWPDSLRQWQNSRVSFHLDWELRTYQMVVLTNMAETQTETKSLSSASSNDNSMAHSLQNAFLQSARPLPFSINNILHQVRLGFFLA